jgi:ABC-2 type transport system permease protein
VRKLIAVAKREFKAAAANKTFVVMTVLGPFLILAITVLPTLLNNDPKIASSGKPVAIYAEREDAGAYLGAAFESQKIPSLRVSDASRAKERVLSGEYAGLVEVPARWPDEEARYYSATGTDAALFGTSQGVLGALATELRVAEAGLSPEAAARLLSKPGFRVVKLGADLSEVTKTDGDFMAILFTALSFVMMIYMTVLLYGQMIGRSVVQEKTGKTVEVMLSSLSSRDLMFGKILGLGLAGMLQYGVWMGMGVLMIKVVGPLFNLSMPAAVTVGNFGWLVFFFLLAFFLYAAGYAALGAAAEDEHHLGQLAWPLILFLVIPMVMISTMIMNPQSPLVLGLSYFPMTAPIVMLVRILVSSPAWWEVAASVGAILLAILGVGFLGAKIFRVGILMTGKRPKIGEVLRWARLK